jgi:hypothetical protein
LWQTREFTKRYFLKSLPQDAWRYCFKTEWLTEAMFFLSLNGMTEDGNVGFLRLNVAKIYHVGVTVIILISGCTLSCEFSKNRNGTNRIIAGPKEDAS